jgi:hypothetical protein
MALIPEAKRNVAVLGASQKPERYSNQAVRLLASFDYRPIPVNPTCDEIGRTFPGNWRLRTQGSRRSMPIAAEHTARRSFGSIQRASGTPTRATGRCPA